MNILVTGVAGFIGSRLAEALLTHGHTVVGIDNLTTGRQANVPPDVDFTEGDIRGDLPAGAYDVIYHAAASYRDRSAWELDAEVNVLGTLNVIRLAQASEARVVYFQTSLCYGPPSSPRPIQIDDPLNPVGSYAVSKTAGEQFIRDCGLPWVSLRLANMYGPRNLSGPVPTFYKRLTEGQPCTVVDSRRDFMYVDDLIWVAVNAAHQGHGPYHVSTGADRSIEEIYWAVARALNFNAPAPIIQPRQPDDVASLLLDPIRTETEFGWEARTPLEVGIDRAVRWYEEYGVAETYTHLAKV